MKEEKRKRKEKRELFFLPPPVSCLPPFYSSPTIVCLPLSPFYFFHPFSLLSSLSFLSKKPSLSLSLPPFLFKPSTVIRIPIHSSPLHSSPVHSQRALFLILTVTVLFFAYSRSRGWRLGGRRWWIRKAGEKTPRSAGDRLGLRPPG